jgi:hypothetical protein
MERVSVQIDLGTVGENQKMTAFAETYLNNSMR